MFRLVLLLAAASGILHAQCEPSEAVRRILYEATFPEKDLTQAAQEARRKAILNSGLQQHPHDYFLLHRLIVQGGDESLEAARQAREKHPDMPVYELIYAAALVGRDTPEAIRRLEALAKSHPELSRVHYVLASTTRWPAFKDEARTKAGLDAFLAACPAPLDERVLNGLLSFGTREQAARVAPAVRARLEKETSPQLIPVWGALWRMEFKVRPPAEHAALRKQILQDLARLEQSPEAGWLHGLDVLRTGYQSAGDPEAVKRIEDKIVERYPATFEAKRIVQERWSRQHPVPRNADREQMEAWQRASLEANREWLKRWPQDSSILHSIFNLLAVLPESTPEEIARTGEALMSAYRRDPYWRTFPPVEFRVAGEFVKRKVNLEQVPGLVEEGYRADAKRRDERLRDDRISQKAESSLAADIERARILLGYYGAVKQPDKVAALDSELAAMQPKELGEKARLLEARAEAAELLGRKLDALLMYRAVLQMRPSKPPAGVEDSVAQNVARLWKELGGTEAGRALLEEKKIQAASESRWERPEKPLPPFALIDLEGRTWKLANLEGKAVLINLWATWCGPCRAELPEFQKLYEKLKARPDAAVLSFNIDQDLGQVAPFMKENNFTFPVLLAHDFVQDHLPLIVIPQNWFLDAAGRHLWTQVGYGHEAGWQAMMLAKLDEVLGKAAR